MAFESEWAEAKQEASVRMGLAGAGERSGGAQSPSGGGAGWLSSSKTAWSGAAGSVGSVRGDLRSALKTLEEKQEGVGTGGKGLVSTVSHATVYRSWQRRIDLVVREAGELAEKLEKAGNAHYKNDEAVRDAFRTQRTRPEGPSAAGGTPPHGEGR